jgi:hypothetical protein
MTSHPRVGKPGSDFRRRLLSRMYAIQALVFGKFLQPAEESRTMRCTMAYISLSTVTSVMPVVL